MQNKAQVENNGWLASDDKVVTIPSQTGVNILDYYQTCTNNMTPVESSGTSGKSSGVYMLATMDDTNNEYGGPYFKINKVAYSAS